MQAFFYSVLNISIILAMDAFYYDSEYSILSGVS